MQLSEIRISTLKPFDGRFTHSNLTASFSERLAVSENSPLAESEEDFRIRAFFDGISHFLPIDRHCFSLNPLFQILNRVTQEANIVIKQAMKKKEGYWKRLFSGETWLEWAEDKTALGRVITLFVDYMGSSYTLENFIRHMDLSLIEAANQEARQVLKELPVSDHPLESFWHPVYDGMLAIDKVLASMLPSLPLAYAQSIEDEANEFARKTRIPRPTALMNNPLPEESSPVIPMRKHPLPLHLPADDSNQQEETVIIPIPPPVIIPDIQYQPLSSAINKIDEFFLPPQDSCVVTTYFDRLKQYLCDKNNISQFSSSLNTLQNQARSRDGLADCFAPLNEFVLQFRQQPSIHCSEAAIKELPGFFSAILKNLERFNDVDCKQLISEMSKATLHWMPVIKGYGRDTYVDFFRFFLLATEKASEDSEVIQAVLSLSLAYSRKHNALFDDLRPDIKQLARKMKGEYPGLPTQVLALDLRSELALVHCPSLLFGDICENISNTIEDFSDQFGSYGLLKLLAGWLALCLMWQAPQLIQLCINRMNQPDRFERRVRSAAEQAPLDRAAPEFSDLEEAQENQDDTWEQARPLALREEEQATEEESSEEPQETQVARPASPARGGYFTRSSASSNVHQRRTTGAAEEPTRPPIGGHHSSRR